MSARFVLFTRYPEPGRTKTRLIGQLGADGAAQLQRRMTAHVLSTLRTTARRMGARVEVRYAGGDEERIRRWLGNGLDLAAQGAGDLGQRMTRAVEQSNRKGSNATILVGADCPTVSPELLQQTVARLADDDVVLGPAGDGGYYLIGLRDPQPVLFEGPDWGQPTVLQTTLDLARQAGLQVSLLPESSDVDRPADLPVWLAAQQTRAETISVILPALNEGPRVEAALQSAAAASNVELIVVDGGSDDDTVHRAEAAGAVVLPGDRHRARQMNAGADLASGGILLFLHADSRLPAGYDRRVRRLLRESRNAAAAFRLRLDAPGWGIRFVEGMINLRSLLGRTPYGDQALCMRRSTFDALGGFPDMPLMEDYAMVRRLQRRGRIAIASDAVTTSARRWQKLGVLRTTLVNQAVIYGYHLGISPERLAAWYRGRPPLA